MHSFFEPLQEEFQSLNPASPTRQRKKPNVVGVRNIEGLAKKLPKGAMVKWGSRFALGATLGGSVGAAASLGISGIIDGIFHHHRHKKPGKPSCHESNVASSSTQDQTASPGNTESLTLGGSQILSSEVPSRSII